MMHETNFELSNDDSRQLVELGSASFAKNFPLERLMEPTDFSAVDAWARVGADGWVGCMVPDEDGDACTPLELVALAHAAGTRLLIDEFTNNVVLIPQLIAEIADADVRSQWQSGHLQRPGYLLCDGTTETIEGTETALRLVFGVSEDFDVYQVTSTADGVVLRRWHAPQVEYVPVSGLGVGAGSVRLTAEPEDEVALRSDAARLDEILRHAQLAHLAGLSGLTSAVLAKTVDYLRVREQFGRVIGEFQSLKHIVADAYSEAMVARLAGQYAAIDSSDRLLRLKAARVLVSASALNASKAALQLHGGIGFTWEETIHFFVKTAALTGTRFGSRRADELYLAERAKELAEGIEEMR